MIHIGNIFEGDEVVLLDEDDQKSNRFTRAFTNCSGGIAGSSYVLICIGVHLAVAFVILLLVWNKGYMNT